MLLKRVAIQIKSGHIYYDMPTNCVNFAVNALPDTRDNLSCHYVCAHGSDYAEHCEPPIKLFRVFVHDECLGEEDTTISEATKKPVNRPPK
jgi:hypothetical protein